MNVHVDTRTIDRGREGVSRAQLRQIRGLPLPERWGNPLSLKAVPNSRVLSGPAFDIARAPAGARLVPLADLEPHECRWGLGHGVPKLSEGAP